MDRRGFLLGATALLVAGCARVPPVEAGMTPSATPPEAAPLAIGEDGTPTGAVVAALLAGALQAQGRPAAGTPLGKDWQAALGHGDLAASGAFGGTLWNALSTNDEPPAAEKMLGDVATLLAPGVGMFDMPGVDGSLVWLVTAATAAAGITSLGRIGSWSKGRAAAVPKLAVSRADGLPGLRTVYGARFSVAEVEDPVERAERLTSGKAAIACFRRTDYTGAPGLVELVDVEKIAVADPGVVLVSETLADAEPEHVLALNTVAKSLTTDALVELQAQVAAGGSAADVAARWLKEQRLA